MKLPKVSREQKIKMVGRLIKKNECLCAALCCKSWKIGETVFLQLVREHGGESAKEAWGVK